MRIFLAGASGVIGVRLVPLLVAAGHIVAGMTRSQEKADVLRAIGADPRSGRSSRTRSRLHHGSTSMRRRAERYPRWTRSPG
jgi:nucleoside-diphosphate-sugar epimerase